MKTNNKEFSLFCITSGESVFNLLVGTTMDPGTGGGGWRWCGGGQY